MKTSLLHCRFACWMPGAPGKEPFREKVGREPVPPSMKGAVPVDGHLRPGDHLVGDILSPAPPSH
ncbi:MAG: hypothetical protein WBJ42_00650 [Thermovirgaceae bacterium]|nr:hypothetical protein [Thermovirgaceae bacterium]